MSFCGIDTLIFLARLLIEAGAVHDAEFLVALGAIIILSLEIAVFRADREGRSDGDIGQAEIGKDTPHQIAAGLAGTVLFIHIAMEHRPAGISGLQAVLQFQHLEYIIRVADRYLRRVRIIGRLRRTGLQDVRETLAVLFGEAIRRPFSRRGLEVIKIARFFLKVLDLFAHKIKNLQSELMPLWRRDILFVICKVADGFIDAVDADGGKMILEIPEVTLGVRK